MAGTEQKRKNVRKPIEESEDRRTARTRQSIKEALRDLMHSKRFERLTVQDIIDRANIGRSTFYAHYQDKDDLVRQFFEEMMESLTRGVKTDPKGERIVFPIAEMFGHLKDQTAAHGAWLEGNGREFLFSVGQNYWCRRIERELKMQIPKGRLPRIPLPVAAQMVTGAATSLLQWWMKSKEPYSPEQMQEMFDRLMLPGVRYALGEDMAEG